MKTILRERATCFEDPNFSRIIYVYKRIIDNSEDFVKELQDICSFIEVYPNDLPFLSASKDEKLLIVMDDVMEKVAISPQILELFTKKSNNLNISLIFSTQERNLIFILKVSLIEPIYAKLLLNTLRMKLASFRIITQGSGTS